MILGDLRNPYMRTPWRRVVNDYEGEIPAHGVVRVTGANIVNGELVYTVDQPKKAGSIFGFENVEYLVNGPHKIPEEGEGWATTLEECGPVLYDSSATPAAGDTWGASDENFKLVKGFSGFAILGDPTTVNGSDVVPAKQRPVGLMFQARGNGTQDFSPTTATEVPITNLTDSSFGSDYFSLDAGVITINRAGYYRSFWQLGFTISYVRNVNIAVAGQLQTRANSGASWSIDDSGGDNAYHPDVAVSGSAVKTCQIDGVHFDFYPEGSQLRLAFLATFSSGSPSVSVGSTTSYIWLESR